MLVRQQETRKIFTCFFACYSFNMREFAKNNMYQRWLFACNRHEYPENLAYTR